MGVRGEYSSNYIGRQYMSPVFREFFEYPRHFLLVVDRETRAFLSSTPIDQEFFVLAKKRIKNKLEIENIAGDEKSHRDGKEYPDIKVFLYF